MFCFAAALIIICGIRVYVYAKGNSETGTFISVIFPERIILGFDIIPVATADNSKIDMFFHFFPVDFSLGIRYVNSNFSLHCIFLHLFHRKPHDFRFNFLLDDAIAAVIFVKLTGLAENLEAIFCDKSLFHKFAVHLPDI